MVKSFGEPTALHSIKLVSNHCIITIPSCVRKCNSNATEKTAYIIIYFYALQPFSIRAEGKAN